MALGILGALRAFAGAELQTKAFWSGAAGGTSLAHRD